MNDLEVLENVFNNAFRRNLEDYRDALGKLEAARGEGRHALAVHREAPPDVDSPASEDPSPDEANRVSSPAADGDQSSERVQLCQTRTRFIDALKRLSQSGIDSREVAQGVQVDPRKWELVDDLEKVTGT